MAKEATLRRTDFDLRGSAALLVDAEQLKGV